MEDAIQYCIEQKILVETLTKYRAEVLGMILEEFDKDKYERTLRAEGREEGREEGEERVNRLIRALLEENRVEDLERSTSDRNYREMLYKEFHI